MLLIQIVMSDIMKYYDAFLFMFLHAFQFLLLLTVVTIIIYYSLGF